MPRVGACLILCLHASQGAEIPKLSNSSALSSGASWNAGGAIPGASDVMLWDATFTTPVSATGALSAMGGNFAVAGIKVTDVGGSRHLESRFVGFQNASSANTLTLGASGIDASDASQAFYAQSKVTLGASQTWQVENANSHLNPAGFNLSEDVTFHAQAAATPFDFGGHTLATTGTGQVTITGGYTLGDGTLEVGNDFFTLQGGSNRTTTVEDSLHLIVNSGTLRLQANSAPTNPGISLSSAAPVTVNGGTFSLRGNSAGSTLVQSGSITLNAGSGLSYLLDAAGPCTTSGTLTVNDTTTWRVAGAGSPDDGANLTGNILGTGNITCLNTATGANGFLRLAGNNSGYSGTFTLAGTANNRSLRLASGDSGSATATWNVGAANTLQVHGVAVQLGTLLGNGTVTNSSNTAAATLHIGSGHFSGVISNGATQTTSLTKTGPGTLMLTGANTYAGPTHVSGGTLITTPAPTGAGMVTVADGAVFGVALATAGSTLTTGNLTIGTTTGGTLQFDFGNLANPTLPALAVDHLLFNGPSTLRVSGTNLGTGTFPLLQYATLDAGGTVIEDLALVLPARTSGWLANTGTGVHLTITSTEQVKWNGNASSAWDVDPDGTQTTGTPNWRTTADNESTRYLQGTGGTDVVTFDDTATGTGTVHLTTTLSPPGLTVNNNIKAYTFAGSGKLSGTTALKKHGTGTLTLSNTAASDYTGGTWIHEGTLRLGDAATPGAGVIAGAISNEATLVLNRPDDHLFTNTLTGTGSVVKAQPNTVTFPAAMALAGPVTLTAGKLKFSAGGSLSNTLSGSGQLEVAGGTLDLLGNLPNTHSGLVTVSAGALRLNKPANTHAIGGNIDLTGTGTLAILANEQVPDTATIRALGSSADSLVGSTGSETFAHAIVNGSAPGTGMILRNNAHITGTATVNQGILGVASGHNATVNAIVMTSPAAIVRMVANSGPSTLNVGAGGITASAGEVQVKFTTSDQDAVLHLAGDLTTTGDFSFTHASYTGVHQNVIHLSGNRTFTIGDATTTTIAPDITSADGLIKAGPGTLTLSAACTASPAGGTTVNAGTLRIDGTLNHAVQVNAAGTLGGTGTLTGAATIHGTMAPGNSVGQLNSSAALTFAPGSDYAFEIASWTGVTPGTGWDHLAVDALVLAATPANPLALHISGTPAGFSETDRSMVIATSTQAITGFNAAAIAIDASGFPGTGTWSIQQTGNTLELTYTVATAYQIWADDVGLNETNHAPSDDPDHDGESNLVEFGLNGEPLSGVSSGKRVGKLATVGTDEALTLTLPVREGADFAGTTGLTAALDGIVYRIQGGNDLGGWELAVSEVTGPDAAALQSDLPDLATGWTYRSFRTPGSTSGDPQEFIRVLVELAP